MPEPIILYDGFCPLCNGFIKFILRFDKKQQFYFTPLNSATAKKIINRLTLNPDLDTVVLFAKQKVYIKSKAVFEITKLLGSPWNLFSMVSILPLKFTDFIYDFIAKNRIKISGRYESCPIPPEKWRTRFI